MLVDLAVLAYANALRVQGWIGDAALWTEHEFFAQPSPTAEFKRRCEDRSVEGLEVEERIERLSAQLRPLLDRANRMLVRNLRALRELREPRTSTLAIAQAGQVNVGAVQTNQALTAPQESAQTTTARGRRKADQR